MSEITTKDERLRREGVRHPRPEKVTAEIVSRSAFFDPRDLLQMKYEMLRHVDVDGSSAAEAARTFGLSRVSFYEAQRHYAEGGLAGLLPRKRGPKGPYKMTGEVMAFVREWVQESRGRPNWDVLSERVRERFGRTVHPRSVERRVRRDAQKGGS